jgi:transposase
LPASRLKRAKHDVLDAQTLAELAQALLPERWTPPPHIYSELQQRLGQGSSFLELRTQINHQLHALVVTPVVIPAVRQRNMQLIESINQHLAPLDAELLAFVKVEQESVGSAPAEADGAPVDELVKQWKAAIALLVTMPGIGLLTACWLVVATLNFTLCETAEAAVHYVGLAPVLCSSGTSVRSRAQIGHSGHARTRTPLYVATLAAARFHPIIKAYYERLRASLASR